MKKIFALILLVLFGCNQKSQFPWSEYSLSEALALNSDRIIFLDFYNDNWGGCVRLEVETLNDDRVIEFAKKHLISIKIDAWDNAQGTELFDQYDGVYIPLLIFLDGSGREIERIIGYKNVEDFLDILNNVLNNTDTFMSLFEKYENGEKNYDLIDKLSYKSEMKQNDSLSTELYSIILNQQSEYDSSTIERADFYFAKLALKNEDTSKMNTFIDLYENSDRIGDAYRRLAYHYKAIKDTLLEINTLKKTIDLFPDSPSVLNSYAWRMTELNTELKDALEKIDKAIMLTDKENSSYPRILDTKAEVLWRMDLFDEAIKVIDEAISIDNEYQYYKDQKTKFKQSKSKIDTDSI